MKKIEELTYKMKTDWDDRINLNHIYWMADKVESNEELWESGKRDLNLMLEGLDKTKFCTWDVLEYGCGVGRILKPASQIFKSVKGIDVSESAISKGRELLSDINNVNIELSSGHDLKNISSETFDLLISFSCLNHISIEILPNIIQELNRVSKLNSFVVLELYVGKNPEVFIEDTITVRGYPEKSLSEAFTKSGFQVINSRELILPYDAKDHERNLTPYLFTLKKTRLPEASINELKNILNSSGEPPADLDWKGSEFEFKLSATLIERLAKKGQIEDLIKALEFTQKKYKKADAEAAELLKKLKQML